jgi:uncharacterized repeat protein (TIGR01451 family)
LGLVVSSLAQPETYQIQIQTNWNAIAYQFTGVQKVTTDLGLTPQPGDELMVFDLAAETFDNYVYEDSGWLPTEPALAPGQGAFYISQTSFTWTVAGSANTPALPLILPSGVLCLVACQTNAPATFDQIVGYPAPSGSLLYRLIPGSSNGAISCQACFLAYSNVGGVWQPETPMANVGESVYIDLPLGPPVIALQPQAQSIECGGTAVFSVVAAGTPPLSYQWLSNSYAITGATASQLTCSNVTFLNDASYSVVISNGYGATNSLSVALTVVDTNPPTIDCPPNMELEAQGASGAIVNFNVTATGDCSMAAVQAFPPSGSMFPIGTNIVECLATDDYGNTNSCYFYLIVLETADVGISITCSSAAVVLSNSFTYTVVVTNGGPNLASNVVATVYLPNGIEYDSATNSQGGFTEGGDVVLWQIGNLGLGATATMTIGATATEASIQVFTIASVTSDTSDTNLENNGATFLSTILTEAETQEPFWFESTIITNQQLLLTLVGPSNQTVAVDVSTDLMNWTFAFNLTLTNGLGSISVPLSQLPGGVFYQAQYSESQTNNLNPPSITVPPQSQTVDAGQTVTFTAQAAGSEPLSYQWMENGTNMDGENGNTLILYSVTAAAAGTYTLAVSDAAGSTNASATLTVRQWNYGIAPDPPYPTLLASTGARHQVVAGFLLGAIETSQIDATPEPSDFTQLTPLPPGNDGVIIPAILVPNQSASIQVLASLPGMLDAWVDFNGDGNWADANDQVCASLPLTAGTNNVIIALPPTAVSGQTWARFRYSSAGGLSFSGDAADGEVEDYPVTISDSPDLTLTATAAPSPVAVGGQLSYFLAITNGSTVPAFNVVVTNFVAAGVTSVVCSASQGICFSNNGVVVAELGSLLAGQWANVTVTVSSGAAGCLTNIAIVSSAAPDANPADNIVTNVTAVLVPPSIISGPATLNLNQGDTGVLSVSAAGSPSLGYQWFLNGSPVAYSTESSLTLFPAATNDAGSYTVMVSNSVGAVFSLPALVSVQQQFTVSAQADLGGTISPAGDTVLNAGASQMFTVVPYPGYTVDSWYLDGVVVLANQTQFTLTNIQSDHSLSVTFDNSTNMDVIPLGGPWFYNTKGVDLGTNWSQPGYDFSSWSNGPALFCDLASTNLYPVPLGTALLVSNQVTYYFLSQFLWYGDTSNVTLLATNYITSGAVFYLNGAPVGQVRMTNYPPSYNSTALAQTNPGQPDILTFSSASLVMGTNLLAVEVHQSSPANPNVAFAMNMNARAALKSTVVVNPTELTISLNQTGKIVAKGLPLPKVGNYTWTTSVAGIPVAQQGQVFITSSDTANNSTAMITGMAPGLVNVQVQYTGGTDGPSDPATCVVNVVQAQMTLGTAGNGPFNASASAPLFNPSPVVVLNNLPAPGAAANPQVTVTGTVTSFIAPIAPDHIFINGVPAASTNMPTSGTGGLGPFTCIFTSQPIYIGDDDFSLTASAVSALNNIGYNTIHITVNRNADGSIASRTVRMDPSVPALPANLANYVAPYSCRLQISDAKAAAAGTPVTALVNTGVDAMKTVPLTLVANTSQFVSQNLFFVPINLALPAGSEALASSRIKAQFGQFINVSYQTGGVTATAQIVPTGVLLVSNRNPLNFVQSGVAADVANNSQDILFTIEAGIDTRPGPVNSTVTVTSLNKLQQNFAAPTAPAGQYAPVQLTGNTITMTQANKTDATSGQYNLYTSTSPPLLALRRQMPLNAGGMQVPNPKVTPLTVTYRGYVSVTLAATGASDIEPVEGIGYLVANPMMPNALDLNPPLVESDFLPLFNPNPIVLITSPAVGMAYNPMTMSVQVQGQIINFINPTVQPNVTVNGAPVTTFTADPNNPPYGPWRATFTHNFPIDGQMPRQTAGVVVWDNLQNMGLGRLDFNAVGGGINAAGLPIAVTAESVNNSYTVPTSAAVSAVVQANNITLAAAMSVMRNNQFRIEANPILRGNLNWMFNFNSLTVLRQTDGMGTTDGASQQVYPFDVTPFGNGFIKGGGGAATARLVLIPQLATPDNVVPPAGAPQVLSFRANPGVFVQATFNGAKQPVRAALASPNGALIMNSGGSVQATTVVPGTYADVGKNPPAISVLLRVGASGFDPVMGTGRPTLAGATFTSFNSRYTGSEVQPMPIQITRNDLAPPNPPPPAAPYKERQQWENFPSVVQNPTMVQPPSLALSRWSNDPADPRFNLFKFPQAGAAANEQLITMISTGTYVGNAMMTAAQVSGAYPGLQFGDPGGWVQLLIPALPNMTATKPLYGASFNFLGNEAGLSATQTDVNGNELANNFSGHRDFCVQLQERPITVVSVNPGPPIPAPASDNFWLRVERSFVNAANDMVPVAPMGSTGNEVVAYLNVNSTAAGPNGPFSGTFPLAGYYRFPSAGASFQNMIAIGGTMAGSEAPSLAMDIPLSTSQTAFEGLNLPNVAISAMNAGMPRRALPPGRYWIRPMMLAPGGGRYVLGRRVPYTVPLVANLVPVATFPGVMQTKFGLIAGDPVPAGPGPGGAPMIPGLTALEQMMLQQAFLAQWARVARDKYATVTSAANRDVYTPGTPNIRVVPLGVLPQPVTVKDFVVPVQLGGSLANTGLGGANTVDVLNNNTDENAFTANIPPPFNANPAAVPGGIYVSGFFGFNNSGARCMSLFDPFTGANPPYGAMAGDNFMVLQTALNSRILTMPVGGMGITAGAAGVLVGGNRNSYAMNAATALSRGIGFCIAHEVGHTLGLVAYRSLVSGYLAGNVAGAPATRLDWFHVGNEWNSTAGFYAQVDHNGQIINARIDQTKFMPPPVGAMVYMTGIPPVGLRQAVGALPLYPTALSAFTAAPMWFPVTDCDNLNLAAPANLVMDSGSFIPFWELVESQDSLVVVSPIFVPAEQAPRAAFSARNMFELQAVLPRE